MRQRIVPVPGAFAGLQHVIATRAGARRAVDIPDAAHAIAVSNPDLTPPLTLPPAQRRATA
jgi:hypothetical protein